MVGEDLAVTEVREGTVLEEAPPRSDAVLYWNPLPPIVASSSLYIPPPCSAWLELNEAPVIVRVPSLYQPPP